MSKYDIEKIVDHLYQTIAIQDMGCPECPSVYYMLIGTNVDGEELYRCHKCKCEWKWSKGIRSVIKHGILKEETER